MPVRYLLPPSYDYHTAQVKVENILSAPLSLGAGVLDRSTIICMLHLPKDIYALPVSFPHRRFNWFSMRMIPHTGFLIAKTRILAGFKYMLQTFLKYCNTLRISVNVDKTRYDYLILQNHTTTISSRPSISQGSAQHCLKHAGKYLFSHTLIYIFLSLYCTCLAATDYMLPQPDTATSQAS